MLETTKAFINLITVSGMVLAFSLIFGAVPLLFKNVRKAGNLYSFINIGIVGLNLGNICYDFIPEMTGECPQTRLHCGAIGLTVIFLIFVESFFEVSHCNHHHKTEANTEMPHDGIKSTHHIHHHDTHNLDDSDDHFGQEHMGYLKNSRNVASVFIFLTAISIHSVLEGLDISVAHGPFTCHILGLLLHKSTESLAIGMALFTSKITKRNAMLLFIAYASLTPASMFVGDAVKRKFDVVELWFKALALGSMLYVVFLEGIGHALIHGKKKKTKLAVLTAGYISSVTFIYLAHNHAHGHHHHSH